MKMLKRWLAFFVVVVLLIGVAFNSRGPLIASQVDGTTEGTADPSAASSGEEQQQVPDGQDQQAQEPENIDGTEGTTPEEGQQAEDQQVQNPPEDQAEPAPETEEPKAEEEKKEDTKEEDKEAEVHQDAMELTQQMTDENSVVICNVKANIPEGTFEANTSDVTMEVGYVAADTTEQIKALMSRNIPEDKILGEFFMYDVKFKVNGEQVEPGKEITITFEQSNFLVKDVKKASTFYYNEANSPAGNGEAEIVKITQRADKIQELQNAGQSIDTVDDYDLSEISLREDGTADMVVMEGRRSTVYGCYLVEEKPVEQVLEYEDDEVKVQVSADAEGVIPDGASLKVVPIKKDSEETKDQYKEVEEKIKEKASEDEFDVAGFLAYDITFIDKDGNKVEPNGEVKVSMEYKKAVLPEEVDEEKAKDAEVTVLHLEEDEKGEVKDVVDMSEDEKVENVETTENKEIKRTEFTTESFSTFTITWKKSWREYRKVKVSLVDEKGREIYSSKVEDIGNLDNTANIDLNELGDKYAPDNYTFVEARLDSWDSSVVADKISYNSKNGDGRYWHYYSNNKWQAWKISDKEQVNAYLVYGKSSPLNTVETVSHSDKGIIMRMIDYETAADGLDEMLGGQYNGPVHQGLLESRLNGRGYPTIKNRNQSLEKLFSGGVAVDNLFRKDIYENTGYFEYSSFENYAYLIGNSFKVYDALGTPSNETPSYYKRGNFMPYNDIKAGAYSTNRNLYDENGNKLSEDSPRYNERLYKTQGKNNFYFGMYMESDFVQPRGGQIDNGEDMIFEFNGDDDLWIFIDNVLVLDIGGEHDAHSGFINFADGTVSVNISSKEKKSTTIKDLFKNAGVFPDGTPWTDKNVDKYFTGNTFKDYQLHTMKMFYMERGAGASNLHMKFNLQTVPKGTVQVKKKLTNTDKEKYANVEFAFQVYAQKIIGMDGDIEKYSDDEYDLLTDAKNSKGEPINFHDEVEIGNKKYNGVFYLKPDESAQFEGLQANRKYYVVEVGVKSSEYDHVIINGIEYKFDNNTQSIKDFKTDEEEVQNRPYVECFNNCSAANSRELQVTKKMKEGQTSEDKFTFNIKLEDQSGKLVNYSGDYYLKDDKGNYYYYENGELKNNGQEGKICGTTKDGNISNIPVGYTVAITKILSGTSFLVTEVNLDDKYAAPVKIPVEGSYKPSDIEGADGEILLGEDAKLTIENALKQSIHVEKTWGTGTTKPENAEVFVGLYKDGSATEEYVVLNNSNEFRASFEKLDSGAYTVKELRECIGSEKKEFIINGKGYIGIGEGDTVTINNKTYIVSYRTIDENSIAQSKVTITNTIAWKMIKRSSSVDSDGNNPLLKGAEFSISNGKLANEQIVYYGISGEDGEIKWYTNKDHSGEEVFLNSLPNGVYTMSETKAPSGYSLGNPWTIQIENGYPISIKQDNKEISPVGENVYYIDNTPLYALPEAGGSGIFWYTAGGTLLMCLAGLLALYKNKRKRGANISI